MSRASKFFLNFTLLALSLTLSFVLAEMIVRIADLAPNVFRLGNAKESAYEPSSNPLLGYVLKSNYRNDAPDCHNTFARTNNFGFRDRERAVEKRPGVRRILLLGDSVVAGHGICDEAKTLSSQLEARLAPRGFEVLNFGQGGYCTLGEVALLKEKGVQFAPEQIILLFVENDYVNSNGAFVDSVKYVRPAYQEQLFLHSALFRWLAIRFNLFHFAQALDPLAHLRTNRHAIGDDNVARGLAMLNDLSQQHNFSVLVALWPYFTDRGIEEPEQHLPAGTANELLIEQLSREQGFPVVRLSPAFVEDFKYRLAQPRKKKKKRPSPRWMYTIGDGVHPSVFGAKLGAAELERALIRSYVVPP